MLVLLHKKALEFSKAFYLFYFNIQMFRIRF